MKDTTSPPGEIVVVGAGMAAHRFVERLLRDPGTAARVTVIGDEGYGPYDRSEVAGLLSGDDPAELQLDRSVFRDDRVRLVRDDRVLRIDRTARTVRTRSRRTYSYDTLVLATGSFASQVAVSGARLPGCFVLHSIEDAEAIRTFVEARSGVLGRPLRGVVIGGGRRGLEAAVALDAAGVATTIVQYADRLLPDRLDEVGAGVLQSALADRGIAVRTRTRTTRLDADDSGAVTALEFQDGTFQRADVVLFTVGVRPRDELARNAGLGVHAQGGVIIDDRCVTSDPHIVAIGEAARFDDRAVDSAAGAHSTAEVAAERACGGATRFTGHEAYLHRTIAGVDIVSFGEPWAASPGAVDVVTLSRRGGVYRKLVLSDDAQTLLGGILVGDTSGHVAFRRAVGERIRGEVAEELGRTAPDEGGTIPACVHIGMSSRELREVIRTEGLTTFTEFGVRLGREPDCARCSLAVARALLELADERLPQKGEDASSERARRVVGSASAGSRVSLSAAGGGEFGPQQLVDIGCIALDLGLSLQVVDSRIELRGVRRGQRSALWERLAAVGILCEESPLRTGSGDAQEQSLPSGESVSPHPRPSSDAARNAVRAMDAGWADRGHSMGRHRASPLRAENPA